MSLIGFVERADHATIRAGDVVFSVGTNLNGVWTFSSLVHSGLCLQDTAYLHGKACPVVHIKDFVVSDVWSAKHEFYVVDFAGAHPEIDDTTRMSIVHEALRYCNVEPHEKAQSYYYMGDPSPNNFPGRPAPGYGFTCATFVIHCYQRALPDGFALIDMDRCPLVSTEDIVKLIERFTAPHVAVTPFRRVYPTFIMGALQSGSFPFSPADWGEWTTPDRFVRRALPSGASPTS